MNNLNNVQSKSTMANFNKFENYDWDNELLSISPESTNLHVLCLNLLTIPSKTKYKIFYKPDLEHAIGYLGNQDKNYIFKHLLKYKYKCDSYRITPYVNFYWAWNMENLKLLFSYFNVKKVLGSRARNLDSLPRYWFNKLYSNFLLNRKHFQEETLIKFLRRVAQE